MQRSHSALEGGDLRIGDMRNYGWVIVSVGILATSIGQGAMISLSIFLQPMSQAMGWSRADISGAAFLSWIFMGIGSLVWGALSDRFGTRPVVLTGGVMLGLGMVTASQAQSLAPSRSCSACSSASPRAASTRR